MADWLKDPLVVRSKSSLKFKRPKSLGTIACENWEIFHYSTRLKLEGADHFCRLAIGAASMPYDFGLTGLAYSQIKWYLDAFFFELMSAYDMLLQEINVRYDINLDVGKVKWSAMKNNLPTKLVGLMESEWEAVWFKKLRSYRNMATHHAYIPTSASTGSPGDEPFDYHYHEVTIWHLDIDTGKWTPEDISISKACPDYLKKMTKHIRAVWTRMAEKFD